MAEIRSARRLRAMPLERFSADHRAEIEAAVASPDKPDRYLLFGPPGSPRPIAMMESRAWWEWHWQRGIDPDRVRPGLGAGVRAAVIERDGYLCRLCWGEVEPDDIHIDHIHPVSLGGSDDLDNLQVAHSRCNLRKGARI